MNPTNRTTMYGFRAILILMALVTFTSQRNLTFVALLPNNESYPFSLSKVKPFLHAATEIIQQKSGYMIDVICLDSGPDRAQATHSAYTIRTALARQNKTVAAFLGPIVEEALEPLAMQANIWRIPVLTAGGTSLIFDNSQYFSTLVRLGFVEDLALIKMLEDLMYKYKWRRAKFLCTHKVGISYGMISICQHMLSIIQARTRKHEEAEGTAVHIDDVYIGEMDSAYEKLLLAEVGDEYGVVILCAQPDVVRSIMITAHRLKFTNGHYVFIVFDLYRTEAELWKPWRRANDSERNKEAKAAFEFVINIGVHRTTGRNYNNVTLAIKEREARLYNHTVKTGNLSETITVFYDAIEIYIAELSHTHHSRGNITQHILHGTHKGITGDAIRFDEHAARYTEYRLYQTGRHGHSSIQSGHFHAIYQYLSYTNKLNQLRAIDWVSFHNRVPPDRPTCPYNKNCAPGLAMTVIIILPTIITFAVMIAFVMCRRHHRGTDLKKLAWRVKWADVTLELSPPREKRFSMEWSRLSSDTRGTVSGDPSYVDHKYTEIGFVRGTRVSIKFLRRKTFTINLDAIGELKRLSENKHDNICTFVAACLDLPFQSILTEYCVRGSLKDVLEQETIVLDWAFRFSLVIDLTKGLIFLHNSEFQSHGNLTTTNCVIDIRFVLKITDFGLHFLRDDADYPTDVFQNEKYNRKLWTAPELLRNKDRPINGTKKGDIYSFAIICQEIVYRLGVFYIESHDFVSPHYKYYTVKKGVEPYLRPTLKSDDCFNAVFYDLIVRSWSEETHTRPSIQAILDTLQKLSKKSGTGSILDNLVARMETYATDLEAQVTERTHAFMEEKHRADDILHLMLPTIVADQLIKGDKVLPESYESVTIFFSDIVGFTALSASCTPMDIIGMLNDLYTVFDSISDIHDVYKVETIGDAYMVVSGLPVRNGIQHAAEIAWMALAILAAVKQFRIRFRPDKELQLRIGLHTGPVCTGVVGHKMPRYCLFGNTVTTAASYESSGLPLKIHISGETKELLDKIGGFEVVSRGVIAMKNRGKVATYWIIGSTSSRAMSTLAVGTHIDRRKTLFPPESRRQSSSPGSRRPTVFPHGSRRPTVFPQSSRRQTISPPSRGQSTVFRGTGPASISQESSQVSAPFQEISPSSFSEENSRSVLFTQDTKQSLSPRGSGRLTVTIKEIDKKPTKVDKHRLKNDTLLRRKSVAPKHGLLAELDERAMAETAAIARTRSHTSEGYDTQQTSLDTQMREKSTSDIKGIDKRKKRLKASKVAPAKIKLSPTKAITRLALKKKVRKNVSRSRSKSSARDTPRNVKKSHSTANEQEESGSDPVFSLTVDAPQSSLKTNEGKSPAQKKAPSGHSRLLLSTEFSNTGSD